MWFGFADIGFHVLVGDTEGFSHFGPVVFFLSQQEGDARPEGSRRAKGLRPLEHGAEAKWRAEGIMELQKPMKARVGGAKQASGPKVARSQATRLR